MANEEKKVFVVWASTPARPDDNKIYLEETAELTEEEYFGYMREKFPQQVIMDFNLIDLELALENHHLPNEYDVWDLIETICAVSVVSMAHAKSKLLDFWRLTLYDTSDGEITEDNVDELIANMDDWI